MLFRRTSTGSSGVRGKSPGPRWQLAGCHSKHNSRGIWPPFPRVRSGTTDVVGGVIDDQIDDDANTSLARRSHEIYEVAHVSQPRIYIVIIRHVIAVVAVWRGIKGKQPDTGNSETSKVVELAAQSSKVSYTISLPYLSFVFRRHYVWSAVVFSEKSRDAPTGGVEKINRPAGIGAKLTRLFLTDQGLPDPQLRVIPASSTLSPNV